MTLWCPNLTLLPSHHHKLNASITPTLWALLFLFTCQPLGSMFQHVCALSQSYCFFPEFALLFHRRQWQPTPVFLPGKSHGQRSLVGYSPWGREESDTTKWLHFHFSLSCTGEGNGNPLHYFCLENPRDGSLVGCHLWGCTELDTTDVT